MLDLKCEVRDGTGGHGQWILRGFVPKMVGDRSYTYCICERVGLNAGSLSEFPLADVRILPQDK